MAICSRSRARPGLTSPLASPAATGVPTGSARSAGLTGEPGTAPRSGDVALKLFAPVRAGCGLKLLAE